MEAFGRFRKILRFFGFLSRFSTFPDVAFTKDFFHGTISASSKMLKQAHSWKCPRVGPGKVNHTALNLRINQYQDLLNIDLALEDTWLGGQDRLLLVPNEVSCHEELRFISGF